MNTIKIYIVYKIRWLYKYMEFSSSSSSNWLNKIKYNKHRVIQKYKNKTTIQLLPISIN